METVIDIDIANGKQDDELEVTMRGTPDAVVKALVGGLSREALKQLHDALGAEIEKRKQK